MSTMQEALLAEFEYIMRRALADEEAPDFRVTGAVLFEGMLRPTWEGVPEGCKPRSAPNVWRPDRPTLVELAARTIMLRSRRWDDATGAVVPWTSNLDEAFRKHWRARFHIGLEVDRGWFDLIAATRAMISDVSEKQAKWGQIKEKFGTLRMYYPKDEKARAVVDCAESRLSGRICETCGAPGRLGEDRGWWRTRCPIHEEKDR